MAHQHHHSSSSARASAAASAGGASAHRAPAAPAAPPPAAAGPAPPSPSDVFACDEESRLFSRGVARFLQRESAGVAAAARPRLITVDELGAGDGVPIVRALAAVSPAVAIKVRGFETCPRAAALARRNAAATPSPHSYEIRLGDFFEQQQQQQQQQHDDADGPRRRVLVCNPPYVPSPSSSSLLLPGLYGGPDGAAVTRRLLALGPRYRAALLIVAGVAHPHGVLEAARRSGWRVRAFEAEALPFGAYTSQPSVRTWIARLEREGLAHTLPGGAGYMWPWSLSAATATAAATRGRRGWTRGCSRS